MHVTFFIGHHKTGSTSLQGYLANNYLTLLKEGILYPAVEAEGMACNLAAVLAGRNPRPEYGQFSVREPHNALSFRLLNEANDFPIPAWHPNLPTGFQMFHMIERQILALKPDHLVLCSEVMTRLADRGAKKMMTRITNRFGHFDATIYLNLRRIDEYIASWHLQLLKFGTPVKPLRDGAHANYYPRVHFRYDTIVEQWKKALPNANLVVRNYNDVLKAGGTVVDFFAQSPIPHVPQAEDDRLNSSIPHCMAEIVRQGNLSHPAHRLAIQGYIEEAMSRISVPRNSEVEMYGAEHRAALLEAFEPVHAALSHSLGLSEFFPDMAAAAQCRPIPEMEAAREALAALKADAPAYARDDAVRDFIANFEFES